MPPRNFLVRTLTPYLKVMSGLGPLVRAGRDVEALHDLRVTTRRLRNALWAFKSFLPPTTRRQWQRSLRGLTRVLGPARDVDVQIEFLRGAQTGTNIPEEKKGFSHLLEIIRLRRHRLQPRVVRAVDGLKRKAVLREIDGLLNGGEFAQEQKARLVRSARKRLLKRWEQLRSYGPIVCHPERKRELHQMRIAAKHLRYTMEILGPLFGRPVQVLLRDVLEIQRCLGEWRDRDLWAADFERLARRHKNNAAMAHVLARLSGDCRRASREAYERFLSRWREMERTGFRERLLSAVSHPGKE